MKIGNVQVGQIFELVKSIGAMLRSFSQLASPAGGINMDPTVWLDGARPTPKYVRKIMMSHQQ